MTVLLLVAVVAAGFGTIAGQDRGPTREPTIPGTGNASPGPAGTPAPTDATGMQLVVAEDVSIRVPADWTVLQADGGTIEVADPGGGRLHLLTGADAGALTVSELQEAIVAGLRATNPDTILCQAPEAMAVPGGPQDGLGFALCFTAVPAGGQAAQIIVIHIVGIQGGTGSAPGLTSYFSYSVFAEHSYMPTFLEAVDMLPPPTWKRYLGL